MSAGTAKAGENRVVSKRKEATRDRIMTAAMSLFAERGYERTTVAEINEASGYTAGSGSLYRHFSSKDELLLAAVKRYRGELAQLSASVDFSTAKSVRDALERAAMILVAFAAAQGPVLKVFALHGLTFPAESREEIAGAWKDGYAICAEFLRTVAPPKLLEQHDLEGLSILLLGSLAHYFGQTTAFSESSLPISLLDCAGSWVSMWTAFIEGGAR